jgi:hypothetical protein
VKAVVEPIDRGDRLLERSQHAVRGEEVKEVRAIDLDPSPIIKTPIPDFVIDVVNGSVSAELIARIASTEGPCHDVGSRSQRLALQGWYEPTSSIPD